MTNTAEKQKVQRDSVEIRFTKVETTLPFLATKADLSDVRTELKLDIANTKIELKHDIANVKEDIANVRTELKEDISKVRTELKQDIADVRSELKEDIADVKSELKDTINNQTKWFVGLIITMIVSVSGSTITILLKLMNH